MSDSPNSSFLRRLSEKKLIVFLMNSWVLAVIFGTVVFLCIPFRPDPYLIKLNDSTNLISNPSDSRMIYKDMNSDGKSEIVTVSNLLDSSSCILVRTRESIILNQWNLDGRLSDGLMDPVFSDYNHDGKFEISLVTISKNQLILNRIDPYGINSDSIFSRLIDTISTQNKEACAQMTPGPALDFDGDGNEEITFSINTYYTRQPRNVYAYDIVKDSLWSSPFSGSLITGIFTTDLDSDGQQEMVGRCYASNNYREKEVVTSDARSWFIVLNNRLSYKVPPVKLGPIYSWTIPVVLPVQGHLENFVYVVGNQDTTLVSDWYAIKPDYSLVKTAFPYKHSFTHPVEILRSADGTGVAFINRFDKPLFIDETGTAYTNRNFPKHAAFIGIINPKAGYKTFQYCFVADQKDVKISFYSAEGDMLGSIKTPGSPMVKNICWTNKVDGVPQLFLVTDKKWEWYSVTQNPWQYLQYLLCVALMGFFLAVIKVLRFSYENDIYKREVLKRELMELQLKMVKNQLDPHFTFNALNGLSYLIMSGETGKANNFISHFSRLLRTHLNTSDQLLVKLSDEIEFLDNYMALQRIRFDDKIQLELEIDPFTDTNLLIPKMIIQTHVENAMKHGLWPKIEDQSVEKGRIRVSVRPAKESTVILIEDNGLGRGNTLHNIEESTGRGLQALDKVYHSVRQLYRIIIEQEFEDLKDNMGNPTGTRVRIVIN